MIGFLPTFAAYRRHGVLPERGGLMDQPATWMDAALELESEMERLMDDRMNRQREEMMRKSRPSRRGAQRGRRR